MTSPRSQLNIEEKLRDSGLSLIAGVDEAGRGPCAGPLVVAAIILSNNKSQSLARVRDSKKLSEKVREELFPILQEEALAFSIIEIWPDELDLLGLHKSNLEGMRRAVSSLAISPEYVLTDGYAIDGIEFPSLAVWKGDQVAFSISAASILAKVHRDRIMIELDARYPGYGLTDHKGYITPSHTAALEKLGVSPIHRKSFANIEKLIHQQV